MKKQMRIIGLIAAVMLLLCAALSGCAGQQQTKLQKAEQDPAAYLMEAIAKTSETVSVKMPEELESVFKSLEEKGSIKVEGTIPEIGEAAASIYYDVKNQAFGGSVSMNYMEQNITAELYANQNALAVKAPQILGDKAYGLPINNLKEDLKNATIWELTGTDYSEIQPEIEKFLDQIEDAMSQSASNDNSPSVLKVKKLVEDVEAVLKECAVAVKESIIGSGDKAPASVTVTYTMTKAQFEKIAELYIEFVEWSVTDAMAGMEGITDGDIDEMIDSLREAVKEFAGEYTVSFNIGNDTGMISQITVSMEGTSEGKPLSLTLLVDLGVDPAASKTQTISLSGKFDNEEHKDALVVTIQNDDTDGVLDRTLTIKAEDMKDDIVIKVNIGKEKFLFSVKAEGETVAVSGKYALSDSALKISDCVITSGDEKLELGVTFTLEAVKEIPAMPSYTNLLQLTEEELMELSETIGSLIPSEEPEYPEIPDDYISANVVIHAENYEEMAMEIPFEEGTLVNDFCLGLIDWENESDAAGIFGFAPDYAWDFAVNVNGEPFTDVSLVLQDGDVVEFVITPVDAG